MVTSRPARKAFVVAAVGHCVGLLFRHPQLTHRQRRAGRRPAALLLHCTLALDAHNSRTTLTKTRAQGNHHLRASPARWPLGDGDDVLPAIADDFCRRTIADYRDRQRSLLRLAVAAVEVF